MPDANGQFPPAPPQPGISLVALSDLRTIALRRLDMPLSPAVHAAWERRLGWLEQAICDAETRVGQLEYWRMGARPRSRHNSADSS